MKFSVTLTPREMRNLSNSLTPTLLRLIEDLTRSGLSGDRIDQVGCPPHHFDQGIGTIRPDCQSGMDAFTARHFLELVCANQNLTNRLAPPDLYEIREMLLSDKPGNPIRPGSLYYQEIWDCLRYANPVDALISLPELCLLKKEIEIAADKLNSILFHTEAGDSEPYAEASRWKRALDENAPEYLHAATGLPRQGTASEKIDWRQNAEHQQISRYLPILTEITGVYDLRSAALVRAIMNNRLALSAQTVAAIESIGVSNFLAVFRLDRCVPYLEDAIAKFKAMPVFKGMGDQIIKEPSPEETPVAYTEPYTEDPNIVHGRTVWRELIDQWRINFDVEGEQPDRKKILSRIVNAHANSLIAYLERYGITGATREALATLDNQSPEDVKVFARLLAENINAVASAIVPGICKYMEYDAERAALPGRTYEIG